MLLLVLLLCYYSRYDCASMIIRLSVCGSSEAKNQSSRRMENILLEACAWTAEQHMANSLKVREKTKRQ